MLITEAHKMTGLTKKAIEYYCQQGLITPSVLENGYRDFSKNDIAKLKKVSVLRKLDISVEDIKSVLRDKTGEALHKLSVQKELSLQRERQKKVMLDKLSSGKSYSAINDELNTIEKSLTITEKLLETFPGYYGRFICLHFARFLNEPIATEKQRLAYEGVVSFLDEVPTMEFSPDLQEYLDEYTAQMDCGLISTVLESMKKTVDNPEKFISDNKEILEQYIEYKKSDEYLNSPAYKIQLHMKEFNNASGYYDIFIPAMKELSPSYAEYYSKLKKADIKMKSEYPEIEDWK